MEKRDPLSTVDNKNVAKVVPMSRLPTPGKSRLPGASRLKLPTPVAEPEVPETPDFSDVADTSLVTRSSKRKSECDNAPAKKKARLNTTISEPNLVSARSSTARRPVRGTKPPATRAPPPRKPAPTSRAPTTGAMKPPVSSTRPGAGSKAPTAASSSVPPAAKAGKKRPAWDLKGRLQDMESEMGSKNRMTSELKDQMMRMSAELSALGEHSSSLKGSVQEKSQTVNELERKLKVSEEELAETSRTLTRRVEDLTYDKSRVERQNASLDGELKASLQECSGLKTSVAQLTSSQAGMSAELSSTKSLMEEYLAKNKELMASLSAAQTAIEEMSEKLRTQETERRKLHNTILELKGNIRVFCRVRPLLGDELLGNNGEIQHIAFPDSAGDKKILALDRCPELGANESSVNARKGSTSRSEFTFDKVFTPESKQAEVFEEISQLVQSALDGYHVCIFAYGQTGSGKTYTMEGPSRADPETEGMIPRAVEQVFSTAEGLRDKGWTYKFEVSFLEIYNETIRDLLGSGAEDVKHEIRMVSANNSEVTVSNLTAVTVTQPHKVHSLLSRAGENRAVAETKCNARSSRSHSVFQMRITGHNSITDESCTGLLNLIDLAGSERLKDSGSEGQRLKETQAINKSLSNLGNVIMALANKESHIPYRNSKLTHVLQHCLGGNSKVLMFANVSPKEECFSETLNSLRFATKVNNCNIGTAQRKK